MPCPEHLPLSQDPQVQGGWGSRDPGAFPIWKTGKGRQAGKKGLGSPPHLKKAPAAPLAANTLLHPRGFLCFDSEAISLSD